MRSPPAPIRPRPRLPRRPPRHRALGGPCSGRRAGLAALPGATRPGPVGGPTADHRPANGPAIFCPGLFCPTFAAVTKTLKGREILRRN
ncbi:MAG: hypothetical protein MUC97_11345 [Bernardetiaceae bacterium]|nr:hypothetical protein [Bernardetiaceae bacterium]